MSSSDADYTSKLTGKSYRLELAPRHCAGCAFTVTTEEAGATRAAKALVHQRSEDCRLSRGCHSPGGPGSVFKEITE